MAVKSLDLAEYGSLLAEAHPTVIEVEEESERVLALIQSLPPKKRETLEERQLLKLLVRLVEDFEEQH